MVEVKTGSLDDDDDRLREIAASVSSARQASYKLEVERKAGIRMIALSVSAAVLTLGVFTIVIAAVSSHSFQKVVVSSGSAETPTWLNIFLTVIISVPLLLSGGTLFLRLKTARGRGIQSRKEAEQRDELHAQNMEAVKRNLGLGSLVVANGEQIDLYHLIATDQADRSFKSSQKAAWVGMIIIACCIAAGLIVKADEVRWFLAGIGGIGSALAGFLNRTYLTMYRESLTQFRHFFDQPVLTSYYLTAERIAESIEERGNREEAIEVRRQIIEQILSTSALLAASSRDQSPKRPGGAKRGNGKAHTVKRPANGAD